jgi:hypothetical protein
MTPFKLIDAILNKHPSVASFTDDEINEHSEYLTNRYVSMSDDRIAVLVNETVNINGYISNKKDHFRFMYRIIPKGLKKRYIKKENSSKKDKESEEQYYRMLAENLELSIREVKEYCEVLKVDPKKLFT